MIQVSCFGHYNITPIGMKTEQRMCAACSEPITDKYLLQVNGRSWHAHCLRCCVCQLALDRQPSCFIKDDSVYCKADYAKSFGAKCSKCCRSISANDWVRKARDHVYHLACFACDACKRQLSTGEEFALHDDRVLCKAHYLETIDGTTTSSDEGGDSESYHSKSKAKRVRTTFTEEQLQVLQANFQLDSNPDGQDLERIAQITGLSKRVTQVWFQNSRARQKKHLNTGKMKSSHCHGAGMGGGRELEPGQFGRHINLHLTYSLQQQSKVSHIYSSHLPMSEPSSLDELSQDSMLMCTLRGEGV
ncbi:LIM/homeobox protein Awh-like isoform X1 [Macrosteles quadrilineatus]|uniref:LIM/homeobox protein Awh-like isoform X1 n=1 Tax=Macrosteles quadrilineatus TaxID=74068 RepID=UPI0023E1133F|nr:LIM/homeobox protein Awh-like isoform X1 [Macrosteles quadrilineatus]XP_054275658.1 LIM/homeobox protein Awh-like isoform X1 [Macrosteles quadrilineatus]